MDMKIDAFSNGRTETHGKEGGHRVKNDDHQS